jgi:NAD+ synthase (glutamine-hydrolysing)
MGEMKPLRIALAQINTTVGDIAGNARKILAYVARARKAGAALVVFPELAVPGYPAEDLFCATPSSRRTCGPGRRSPAR